MYDREREDSLFVPRDPGIDPIALASSLPNAPNGVVSNLADPSLNPNVASLTDGISADSTYRSGERFEWHALEDILVTPGPSGSAQGAAPTGKDKVLRNPISHWRVSRKSLTGASTYLKWLSFSRTHHESFQPSPLPQIVGMWPSCLRMGIYGLLMRYQNGQSASDHTRDMAHSSFNSVDSRTHTLHTLEASRVLLGVLTGDLSW